MIQLPFPPADLSGHNNGGWNAKAKIIAQHRHWAKQATMKARPTVSQEGDIHITFRFIPPDNRGDRTNFPIRIKPIIDGIADALKVNDKRFHPHYIFEPAAKPGRLEVYIG